MSSQDLLDIFRSDAAANNKDNIDASSNLNVESNEVTPNCNSSSTLVQQDSPESILFDFSDEGNVNNSERSSFEDFMKQPAESNCANMDDLLGIFDNSEPIHTKANNPAVDLLGGFTQLNSNANDLADSTSDEGGLVFSGDGSSVINIHALGNKDTSELNLVEIANLVVTELSTAVTSSNQTGSNLTSDSGDTTFNIGFSEDTKTSAKNDLLSLTDLTSNQNCIGEMDSNMMYDLENSVSETHEMKNEDMEDKVDSTELIDTQSEPIASHTIDSELHEEVKDVKNSRDMLHTSNAAVHVKSVNVLKIENQDLLNSGLTPGILPAQQPLLTLVPPQNEDLVPVASENRDTSDTKDGCQDHEIANDNTPDSYSELIPSGILMMSENLQMSSEQSEICLTPSNSPTRPTILEGEVKSAYVGINRSNQPDTILSLNSESQQSCYDDDTTMTESWIDTAKQGNLVESSGSVKDMLVSMDRSVHLQTNDENSQITVALPEDGDVLTPPEADHGSISASLVIDQSKHNNLQLFDQEHVADGNGASSDGEILNGVGMAGSKDLPMIEAFSTVGGLRIALNASPLVVGEMLCDDAADHVESEAKPLLPDLLNLSANNLQKQDDGPTVQQMHFNILGDPNTDSINSPSSVPAYFETKESTADVSDDKQKSDDILLFQDDTSLNTFKKSDTILHDTLESFNDMSTSTVENSVVELPFEEAISKYTPCEGENVIRLPDTTTENDCSKNMSRILHDVEVSDVVEELLQKVHLGAAADLGNNRDVIVEEVNLHEVQEDKSSDDTIDQKTINVVPMSLSMSGSAPAEIESQKMEGTVQQPMVEESDTLFSFDESHDKIGDDVSSSFTLNERYDSSSTSDGEVDCCDDKHRSKSKQSTEIPALMPLNEHDIPKDTASLDSNFDGSSASIGMPKEEQAQSILESVNCSDSADDKVIETDQMPSMIGNITEIFTKDSLQVYLDSSIPSNQSVEITVTDNTIERHSSDEENYFHKDIAPEEVTQSVGAESNRDIVNDSHGDGFEHFTNTELSTGQETDDALHDTNPLSPSVMGTMSSPIDNLQEANSTTDDVSCISLQQSDLSSYSTQHDYENHTTSSNSQNSEATSEETVDRSSADNVVTTMFVETIAIENVEDPHNAYISNEIDMINTYASSKSDTDVTALLTQTSEVDLHCDESHENGKRLDPTIAEVKSGSLESISSTAAIVTQDAEETLPVIPKRKSKKRASFIDPLESMQPVTGSSAQDQTAHAKDESLTLHDETDVLSKEVFEEGDGISSLMQGPIAARLVERLVDDIMYNAITIVRDDILSETDKITGSSISEDESSIDEELGSDSSKIEDNVEIPILVSQTPKICMEVNAHTLDTGNVSANNAFLDIKSDDENECPPEAPVRKKKKHQSHEPPDLEDKDAKEKSESAHELSVAKEQTCDLLPPEMIIGSPTNPSESIIGDSNMPSEDGNNNGSTGTISELTSDTVSNSSPINLITGQSLPEDSCSRIEIGNDTQGDDKSQLLFDISDDKNHPEESDRIAISEVNQSFYESSTSQDGNEMEVSSKNQEVLITGNDEKVEKSDMNNLDIMKEHLNESVTDYPEDLSPLTSEISPTATDHIVETCITSAPLLNINDNQSTTVKDELSTTFINNAENNGVGVGTMNRVTTYHSQTDGALLESDIVGISDVNANGSTEGELMIESYDLQEKLQHSNGYNVVMEPSSVTVRTSEADKIQSNENGPFEKVQESLSSNNDHLSDPKMHLPDAYKVTDGDLTENHDEDKQQDSLAGQGQQLAPPPLPEADYEDMNFDELPRSKSDIAMGGEYFDEGYYTLEASYKGTGDVGSGVSIPSSFMKKSASLPASYYSNFSATIPSTVFIDKDLLSDNDDSDAESVKSAASNDEKVADSDDLLSSAAINAFVMKQYKSLSTDPTDSSISDFDPQSSYQAYDNDWEDIITEPFRRFSDLPVILEESETSEVDESDQDSDGNVSNDPDSILHETDVEIPSLSLGDQACDVDIVNIDVTQPKEISDDLFSEKENYIESFEGTNAMMIDNPVKSIRDQLLSSDPESTDTSNYMEHNEIANNCNIISYENVAESRMLSKQKPVDVQSEDSQAIKEQTPGSLAVHEKNPDYLQTFEECLDETLPAMHGASYPQLQITLVDKSDPSIIHEENQPIEKEGNMGMVNLHSAKESHAETVLPLHDDSTETTTQKIAPTNFSTPTALNEDETYLEERLYETNMDTADYPQFTTENHIQTSSDVGLLYSDSVEVSSSQIALTDSSELSTVNTDKQNQKVEDKGPEIIDIEQLQASKESNLETTASTKNSSHETVEDQSTLADLLKPSVVIAGDHKLQERIDETGEPSENPQISKEHHYTLEVLCSSITSVDSKPHEISESDETLKQESLEIGTTMQYPQVIEEFHNEALISVPNNTELSLVSENDVINENVKTVTSNGSSSETLLPLQILPEQTEYDPAPQQKSHETVEDPNDSDERHDETLGDTEAAPQQITLTDAVISAADNKKDLGLRETNFETGINIVDPRMSEEHHEIALSSLHGQIHQESPGQNTFPEYSESITMTVDDQKVIEDGSFQTDAIMEQGASEHYDNTVVSLHDNPNEMVSQPVTSLASAEHAELTTNDFTLEKEFQNKHVNAEQPQSTNESLDETGSTHLLDETGSTFLNDDIREVPLPPQQVALIDSSNQLLENAGPLQQSEENASAITQLYSTPTRYYDISEGESMDYCHGSIREVSSNPINDVDKSIPKGTSDIFTDTFSASCKETSNTENTNTSKGMEISSQQNSVSPGSANTEGLMSHEIDISDSKCSLEEPIPVGCIADIAKATDLKASQNINAKDTSEMEKNSDELSAMSNEIIDEKPPPPPSRKKKKAKQSQSTNVNLSVADETEGNLSPKNNMTHDSGDLPEIIDNAACTSELKVATINNETHYHEQEQLEKPSSIIYDNATAKPVAEVESKRTEFTDSETALENCAAATTLIMAGEVTFTENQGYRDSQDGEDGDQQNSESERIPVLIEDHGHNASKLITPVLCTDADGVETIEGEFKPEGYDIGSQETSNLFHSLEDDNDLLKAEVFQTVSSTPEKEVIVLDSISKEAVSTGAQEIMKQALLLPDSASNATSSNSTIDGYSSSENEYKISDEDVDNAVEMPEFLQSYHIFADKLISSIMNDVVASVEAVVRESSLYHEHDNEKILVECIDHAAVVVIENMDTHKNSSSSEAKVTTSYDETLSGKVDEVNDLLEITEIQKSCPTIPADILEILNDEDETPQLTKDLKRQRFDTTGSIRYLTDSEEDDAEDKGKPNRLISLDDDIFVEDSAESTNSTSQESEEGNNLVAKRKSLVPPSSLVLSVALDEIDLRDKSDVQETPVSQRLSLSSSLTSSQTSLASSGGEAAGNRRSMLPRLPSLRLKKAANPVVPEVIKTKYHYVDPEEIIPIVPMPDLKRVIKWENVTIRNIEYQIDEAVVQPYKKVISHGGFYDAKSTIIEIFLPYLPAANLQHYEWIMDNLFLYVLATVELLAQGKFSIVIFVGPKSHIPANALLRRWHQHVEYRLKKNVEAFYIVNPTFYFKTMARLFVSRKVNKKMKYVKSLAELGTYIPTDFLFVPPEIAK